MSIKWGVIEDGNRVLIEFICRDNYEAIEMAEVCADGLADGELTIEVTPDEGEKT